MLISFSNAGTCVVWVLQKKKSEEFLSFTILFPSITTDVWVTFELDRIDFSHLLIALTHPVEKSKQKTLPQPIPNAAIPFSLEANPAIPMIKPCTT